MAATTIPAPGTQAKLRGRWESIGPCLPTCEHPGCLANRRGAEARCPLCGWVIGYDVAHYRTDEPIPTGNAEVAPSGSLVHALCYELKIERERGRR